MGLLLHSSTGESSRRISRLGSTTTYRRRRFRNPRRGQGHLLVPRSRMVSTGCRAVRPQRAVRRRSNILRFFPGGQRDRSFLSYTMGPDNPRTQHNHQRICFLHLHRRCMGRALRGLSRGWKWELDPSGESDSRQCQIWRRQCHGGSSTIWRWKWFMDHARSRKSTFAAQGSME